MRSSSFTPYQQGSRQSPALKDASDFLRKHDKLAGLLPAVTRLAALQADCATALPAMFGPCAVMSYDSEQLVLAIPNAALATRLKQQLPKLQDSLHKRGWQVIAIRLKVQVIPKVTEEKPPKQLQLPSQALTALASLHQTLEDTPANRDLKAALATLVKRHRP
ncbi:MAG: DUF721 domain-containing protein [Burkholderiaceae bacterium]|nr:DUF721 domain-containing protein [Burkholderiaceae bacterium]